MRFLYACFILFFISVSAKADTLVYYEDLNECGAFVNLYSIDSEAPRLIKADQLNGYLLDGYDNLVKDAYLGASIYPCSNEAAKVVARGIKVSHLESTVYTDRHSVLTNVMTSEYIYRSQYARNIHVGLEKQAEYDYLDGAQDIFISPFTETEEFMDCITSGSGQRCEMELNNARGEYLARVQSAIATPNCFYSPIYCKDSGRIRTYQRRYPAFLYAYDFSLPLVEAILIDIRTNQESGNKKRRFNSGENIIRNAYISEKSLLYILSENRISDEVLLKIYWASLRRMNKHQREIVLDRVRKLVRENSDPSLGIESLKAYLELFSLAVNCNKEMIDSKNLEDNSVFSATFFYYPINSELVFYDLFCAENK